jgi:hypothetical protein
VAQSGASNAMTVNQLGEVMAETNCVECGHLHDTYNAATIRYMNFYEYTSSTRDVQQGNQLFTEMNDAMLAFKSHQKTHPPRMEAAEIRSCRATNYHVAA